MSKSTNDLKIHNLDDIKIICSNLRTNNQTLEKINSLRGLKDSNDLRGVFKAYELNTFKVRDKYNNILENIH